MVKIWNYRAFLQTAVNGHLEAIRQIYSQGKNKDDSLQQVSDDKIFKKFQKHPDVDQQIEGWQERNGQTILLKDGENVEKDTFFLNLL